MRLSIPTVSFLVQFQSGIPCLQNFFLRHIWIVSIPELISTVIILWSKSTCCIETVVCRYRNFFNRPVTLSTCVQTWESCLEVSTSYWDNCDFHFVKQVILRTALADGISSWRSKSLSARTRLPKVNFLRNSDCKVICLSDTRRPHPDERRLTRPVGVTRTKYFTVLLCL